MAYGEIHTRTGTVCKASSDATCPYSGESEMAHVTDLGQFADYHGVDSKELTAKVVNDRMNPREAADLLKEGVSDAPPAVTRSNFVPAQRVPETDQQRYERELHQYKVKMRDYEDNQLARYGHEVANRQPFAPAPVAPPFRTIYPKSFEGYDQMPKDFLPETLPPEIGYSEEAEGLWQEYRRKRKQMGDNSQTRVYYL